MSTYKLDEKIKDQFKSLPEVVQDAITESNWQESIRRIVQKYSIRIDQGAIIESETLLVMLGFERPEDFTQNIIKEASIPIEIAQKIEREVATEIFDKIRQSLVDQTGKKEAETNDLDFFGTENKNPDKPEAEKIRPIELEDHEIIESREEMMKMIEDEEHTPAPPSNQIEAHSHEDESAPEKQSAVVPPPENLPVAEKQASPATKLEVAPITPEPAVTEEQTVPQTIADRLTKPSVATPTRQHDPYREPIE